MRRATRVFAWTGASLALGAVFLLYTRPQMMVALGDMIWACFR